MVMNVFVCFFYGMSMPVKCLLGYRWNWMTTNVTGGIRIWVRNKKAESIVVFFCFVVTSKFGSMYFWTFGQNRFVHVNPMLTHLICKLKNKENVSHHGRIFVFVCVSWPYVCQSCMLHWAKIMFSAKYFRIYIHFQKCLTI